MNPLTVRVPGYDWDRTEEKALRTDGSTNGAALAESLSLAKQHAPCGRISSEYERDKPGEPAGATGPMWDPRQLPGHSGILTPLVSQLPQTFSAILRGGAGFSRPTPRRWPGSPYLSTWPPGISRRRPPPVRDRTGMKGARMSSSCLLGLAVSHGILQEAAERPVCTHTGAQGAGAQG